MAGRRISASPRPRNQLLAALSVDFALLQPHLQSMELGLKKDIERPKAGRIATHSNTSATHSNNHAVRDKVRIR